MLFKFLDDFEIRKEKEGKEKEGKKYFGLNCRLKHYILLCIECYIY